MRVKDKIAIVTGSGGGIGRATVIRLAEEGAKVVINDIEEGIAQESSQMVREGGGEAIVFVGDVTKRKEAEELIESTVESFGRIDILVNNVGGAKDALLKNMTEEDWGYAININLKGSFNCTQLASKYMVRDSYGKIIFIASRAYLGNIGQANYAAAKAGLVGLTRTLSKELGRDNINVNCLALGAIGTPPMKEWLATHEKFKDRIIGDTPLRRIGEPIDVANTILFFVSDESCFISGDVIHVTGGRY